MGPPYYYFLVHQLRGVFKPALSLRLIRVSFGGAREPGSDSTAPLTFKKICVDSTTATALADSTRLLQNDPQPEQPIVKDFLSSSSLLTHTLGGLVRRRVGAEGEDQGWTRRAGRRGPDDGGATHRRRILTPGRSHYPTTVFLMHITNL